MPNKPTPDQPSALTRKPPDDDPEQLGNQVAALARQLKRVADGIAQISRTGRPDAFGISHQLQVLHEALNVEELRSKCSTLLALYQNATSDAVLHLDADFKDACAAKGWFVDGEWPKYHVQRVIRVHIDEQASIATVGDTILPTLAIAEIITAVEVQGRELLPKTFQPQQFLDTLAVKYDHLAGGSVAVPLWALYREILLDQQPKSLWRTGKAEVFKTYSEQRFRGCLTKLLLEGVTKTKDGRELRLLPALKPEDGMYLYQPGEQRFGFVGRIEFIPAAEGVTK